MLRKTVIATHCGSMHTAALALMRNPPPLLPPRRTAVRRSPNTLSPLSSTRQKREQTFALLGVEVDVKFELLSCNSTVNESEIA